MKQTKFWVKLILALYLLAGVILWFGNPSWFPDFYRPHLMAVLALVSILLILLPRFIFKNSSSQPKKKTVTELESMTAITLFINGLGGLGLYKLYLIGFPYDKFAHFVVSFIFVVALSRFIEIWYSVTANRALFFAAILVIAAGLGWELIEATSDRLLGTELLGGGSSQIFGDTVWDVVMDFAGAILGIGIGFVLFQRRGVPVVEAVELVEKEKKTA